MNSIIARIHALWPKDFEPNKPIETLDQYADAQKALLLTEIIKILRGYDLRQDLHQLIRVCLTNPSDLDGFIKANYPSEYAEFVELDSGHHTSSGLNSFVTRLQRSLRNSRYGKCSVSSRDLREIIYHFIRLDNEKRGRK